MRSIFRTLALVASVALAPMLSAQATTAKPAMAQPPKKMAKPAAALTQVDINTATSAELEAVKGIGTVYAAKIIAGRPYSNKLQLVQKKILTQGVYDKIKSHIVAKQM